VSIAKFHAEWLNLLEVDGPFLTLPVLTERLRSGLEPTDTELVAELHTAQREVEDDPTLQPVWTRWVITRLLGFPDEVLREGAAIGPSLTHRVAEHGQTLRPDVAVVERADDGIERARLIVNIWPAGTGLVERPAGERWAASPIERTAELCRATTVRLGLVTNGDTWTLVDAPVDGTTGTATWDATLWGEERTTLDAFVTLLGVRRFFTVADNETLEALLAQSANAEAEVTDQLGKQVRAAVELLVDAMSRADRERGGVVFRDLAKAALDQDLEPYLYEAAVTVLMRLVFLLSAEERGLFLLGEPTYDAMYAVSTLLAQLEEDASRYGEDVLERRTDAWHRLLATFRMVHAGAAHSTLRLPPYGGNLFDPDRFPFLEGRRLEHPADESATPLRIDNRTIKHILDALQVLRFRGKDGWQEARRLSFRTLGVEQIGHVYEGLLDHGVVQVSAEAVALTGKNDPEVALELIEEAAAKGHSPLVTWLAELTGDSAKSVEKALAADPDPDHLDRLASACDNDPDLAGRIAPYLGLVRADLRGLPQVYLPNSYYVTKASDRRSSGAYYTPRSLAEEMVLHALEPLIYSPGPAEGAEPAPENLRSSSDILDLRVCDMAMGSGAFLVASCRYLAERLLEAWAAERLVSGGVIALAGGATALMPDDESDREILARRLIADRCLYGVDRNPMAVEMAKLSMWLITLAKDRPFTFIDHALRCGDSLLGITDLRQLDSFHLDPVRGRELYGGTLFDPSACIEPLVKAALEKRRQLEAFTVIDVRDAEYKRQLLDESDSLLDQLKVIGSLVVGAALSTAGEGTSAYDSRLLSAADEVSAALDPGRSDDDRRARFVDLESTSLYWLDEGRPALSPARQCLHWVLEFPEVFIGRPTAGFDAIVGNPPFLGNKYWKSTLGASFQAIAKYILGSVVGKVDLVVIFFRRAAILAPGRYAGLLANHNIRHGEALPVGLAALLGNGAVVYRAERSVPWPGLATVDISKIWIALSTYRGPCNLDGIQVAAIGADLNEERQSVGSPHPLKHGIVAFEGSHNGKGESLLIGEESDWFATLRAGSFLHRYITSDDLLTRALGEPKRFVVDVGDIDLEEVRRASPETEEFLQRVVRPARTPAVLKPYRGLSERWWQLWNHRAPQYRSLRKRPECVVVPKVAKYVTAVRCPSEWTFTNKLVVVEMSRLDMHAILSSSFFAEWCWLYSGRMSQRISLSLSTAVLSFPLPDVVASDATELAANLEQRLLALGVADGGGLTKALNRLHDESKSSSEVEEMRSDLKAIDEAVAAAYGWVQPLDHGFHETERGACFTVAPSIRRRVLDRLLLLNRERLELEHARQPTSADRNAGAATRRRVSAPSPAESLF
jgi:hypothetical protein